MVSIINFIKNKNKIIFLGIIIASFLNKISYASNINVGYIDLNKALILHPKMMYFDYNRLGFYKNKISKETNIYNSNNNISDIEPLKKRIRELNITLSKIPPTNEDNLINIQTEIDSLKKELSDLEFEINNNDITNVPETRIILSEISEEVFETINEIAEEQNLSVVLNNSDISYNTFPSTYVNRSAFKKTITSGLDNPYQLFMFDIFKAAKSGDTPSSINLSNWLEYSRDPSLVSDLPLKSQNIVIKGGKDILTDVLRRIYLKNNISSQNFQKLEMALIEINFVKYLKWKGKYEKNNNNLPLLI